MKHPFSPAALILSLSLFFGAPAFAAGPEFQSGDLIFQTSQSAQSRVIQAATGSPFSHVGIIEVAPDGRKFVVEAISTVSRTPFESWVARGTRGQYAVYRHASLGAQRGQALVAAAKAFLGRGYDIYFTSHNSEIYCSELVDLAARRIGLTIGAYQALGSLNVNNPTVRGLIQQRWRGHPLCRGMGSFDACWDAIMRDQLITPVALTRDGQVRRVFSSF